MKSKIKKKENSLNPKLQLKPAWISVTVFCHILAHFDFYLLHLQNLHDI